MGFGLDRPRGRAPPVGGGNGAREHTARRATARPASQVACTAAKMTGEPSGTGGEAPGETRQHRKALLQTHAGQDELNSMDARGATTSPAGTAKGYLAAEVQSSSPRRPREGATARHQLDSSQNANHGCKLAFTSPAENDRADDAEAYTRDHAPAARHLSHHLSRSRCRSADRRSTTTPVAISSHDDVARREQQLTRPLNSLSRSGQRTAVQLRPHEKPGGVR